MVADFIKNMRNNAAISSVDAKGNVVGNGGNGLSVLTSMGGDLTDLLDNYSKQQAGLAMARAYQDYLTGIASQMGDALENRAEKYDTKLQNMFNSAEPQYLAEANTQLPELVQLNNDILNQGTEAQKANRRQIEAILANQGVRGGQAAILENRALGETTRDLQRDINQNIYNEALNRQNSRLNYYGQKSLSPWTTMSGSYGSSLVGANNALSKAQGITYANAYDKAINNYVNTLKNKGNKFANIVSGMVKGGMTGAQTGNPWAAAAGAAVGAGIGAVK